MLIDIGSTHNLMMSKFASKLGTSTTKIEPCEVLLCNVECRFFGNPYSATRKFLQILKFGWGVLKKRSLRKKQEVFVINIHKASNEFEPNCKIPIVVEAFFQFIRVIS